jgi:hypothetical protein
MSLESEELVRRREILRRAAWLLGGAISAPAALAFLQGCSAREGKAGDEQSGEAPHADALAAGGRRFLDAAEFALVAEIAEIMLPRTDTAGARDADVPAFIDAALAGLYSQTDQQRFRDGCAQFDAVQSSTGKPFLEREPAERVAAVRSALESALASHQDYKPFILATRELALLGYFSSRVGITENMEYVAVPTAYHGCVPLSQLPKHVYWE